MGDFRVEIVQLSDFGRHSELGGGGRDPFSPRWDEGDVPRETEIRRLPPRKTSQDVANGVWASDDRGAAALKWEAVGGRETRWRTVGRTTFGLTKARVLSAILI